MNNKSRIQLRTFVERFAISLAFSNAVFCPAIANAAGSKTIYLLTRNGSKIAARNFTAGRVSAHTALPAGDYFNLVDSNKGGDFGIQYTSGDTSFQIILQGQHLGRGRHEAEHTLRTLTGLSNSALCTLRIAVGAPAPSSYAGKELGLSFCPGAVWLR